METKHLKHQSPDTTPQDNPEFLQKGEKPWAPTPFEKAVQYFNPFLKYVFNLKPAIPNLIYVIVSVGVMQLLKSKGFFPKAEWLEPFLFYGLFLGIAVQILFASAKTISVPLITIGISSLAIWAQTNQGAQLPINKEIFQYMMALGAVGTIISSLCNY